MEKENIQQLAQEAGIDEEKLKEAVLAEEFSVWKKNAPFLYDLVKTNLLDWPSLTCEWFQKKVTNPGKDYSEQKVLLGTHTSEQEQNYLLVANVKLPNPDLDIDVREYDETKGELGSYGGISSKFEISVKINHDGEINRARLMPQDEFIVATKTIAGPLNIFDISKCPSIPKDSETRPMLKLAGHEGEGYGLDWNQNDKGKLISGGDDAKLFLFDAIGGKSLQEMTSHKKSIGDCRFHSTDPNLFGSVSDDCSLKLWDIRNSESSCETTVMAHSDGANCVSFNPFKAQLLLTAGADNLAKLWDMRKLVKPLHTFRGHTEPVMQLEWSPFNMAVFATCAEDRRVMLWDTAKIGEEQTPGDAAAGPPELMFNHSGHTDKVNDFSWNKNEEFVFCSVSNDNVLQVWQPSDDLCYEESLRTIVDKMTPQEVF